MSTDFDVVIIGSGPAGVSAAFPLVEAGLRVLMLDGGKQASAPRPAENFIQERATQDDQWQWMVGEHFHPLQMRDALSPKLRVPGHAHVFDGFREGNRIDTDRFVALGSLAPGGLSNAWGCGVARLTGAELDDYPCDPDELASSYQRVARRIGISGPASDELSDYFALDGWGQREIPLDTIHAAMQRKYLARRDGLAAEGFRMGRFRLAALSEDRGERLGCNQSGNCLFGCERRSLYSATEDLLLLKRFDNFHHAELVVEDLEQQGQGWLVRGTQPRDGSPGAFRAGQVYLAAGTIASTRLALNALQLAAPVRMLSCPTAAFILWLPTFLGAHRTNAFGSAQLAFVQKLREDVTALGSTFSTTGLPMSEFARHLPLRRRYAVDFLRALMSSCVVGNMFLPGHLSDNQAMLTPDGSLRITGGHHGDVADLLKLAASRLRRAYARLGAFMLPTSFTPGPPGGDIHYAGSLPMRSQPVRGQTDADGQLHGLSGLYVVDGASLPSLSEKSHTLTIMANADRIANAAVRRMQRQPIQRVFHD